MPPASPRPRFARFPFIRLKALAPLELAVRLLQHCVRGCSPRIIQIMSNREKPVRHNPGWLSDVSLLHYRNVPHSEIRVIQYRSPIPFDGRGTKDITLLESTGWLSLFMPPFGSRHTLRSWPRSLHRFAGKDGSSLSVSPLNHAQGSTPIHPLRPSIYKPPT